MNAAVLNTSFLVGLALAFVNQLGEIPFSTSDSAAQYLKKQIHQPHFPFPAIMTDQGPEVHHDFQAKRPRSHTQRLERARKTGKPIDEQPQVRSTIPATNTMNLNIDQWKGNLLWCCSNQETK